MTDKQKLVARLLEENKITTAEAVVLMTDVQPVYINSGSPVICPGNTAAPFWIGQPVTVTYGNIGLDLSSGGDTATTFEYNALTGQYAQAPR